ncbi:MAG TPA: SDR family NAD(P)-dependent oxidoreductase, partial [Caldithrix abyssi]|nr:SDR family NAD(P)-dependent oxidoreductase [Caldithrix abyssi]
MTSEFTNYNDPNFKPRTLVDLLRWRAVTQPDERAYTFLKDGEKKEIHLTYGELDRRARAVANTLVRKGLSGERALLIYPPGLDYIIGYFGCMYAGVIAVPVYPPDPNRLNRSLPRLQAIVRDAQATVALTTDSILYMIKMLKLGTKFSGSFNRIPFMRKFRTSMKYFAPSNSAIAESTELGDLQWLSTDSMALGLADGWNPPDIDGDSISFLQYTSGSTGTPKGVILTHNNLLSNSEIIYNLVGYTPNSEGVFWLPIYHDMGLIGGVLQPLYGGIPSTLMSPIAFLQRPLRWLEAISRIKDKDVGSAAPNFAYDLCIKKATPEIVRKLDLSNWRFTISGAEPVRHQTIERFTEIFSPAGFRRETFMPAYGLAEATLLVTGAPLKEHPVYKSVDREELEKGLLKEVSEDDPKQTMLVSSGNNQPGQETKIVNGETFLECKPGEIGEIWVKGPSVSKGYYNNVQATKETFHNYLADSGDGPYLRTGDLGFMVDGELFVAGRIKDLIIIRGRNYYPQDIELIVEEAHPELRKGCSAAISIEDETQENLVVIAEVRQSKNLPFDEIAQAIRQSITETFDIQTKSVILIKARTIPKTSSGKIQRHAAKNEYLEGTLHIVYEWHLSVMPVAEPEVVKDEKAAAPAEVAVEVKAKEEAQKTETALAIEGWLVSHLAEELGVAERDIDLKKPFTSYGLDSAQAIGMIGDLEIWLDRTLSPTVIWDYPNIESLALYLAGEGVAPAPVEKKKRPGRMGEHEPIAVIGYSLRMPGAQNAQEFWKNLMEGVDAIEEVPPDRWDVDLFYDPNPGTPQKMVTKWGGFMKDVDKFDPQFFGISPREAAHIDPQQRLLLEVTWEAFEDAGQTWDNIADTSTGVFVGISSSDYSRLQSGDFSRLDAYSGTGNAFSIAANRISFVYDLKGPSFPVDTACSSSLVAVHNAVTSLRRGESDMAVAAGVNLILAPDITITFSQARMMSPDGRCKTFDDEANGYVRGEGVGVVILKRLSDALRDGDHIHAVIRGSAVNQDGRSNGITAPNGLAQQACIRQALDDARLNPNQVGYFEAHGTGTSLGDPIEVNALKTVMTEGRSENTPLYIGSVKSNIGHLESAAGISGLLKTIMVLENELIPQTLHFKKLNRHINLDGTNIIVAKEPIPWKKGSTPRFAGVSAYGFGGANAHLVLQEAPDQDEIAAAQRDVPEKLGMLLLPVSAHNPNSLKGLADKYSRFLDDEKFDKNEYLIDLIYSAGERRSHLDYRIAVYGESKEDFISALKAYAQGEQPENLNEGTAEANATNKIVFIFSGQGPQWYAMGRQLMESEPVYKETIETIDRLLSQYTDWSLTEELMADEENTRLAETEIAQPAIFALQVALAALWEHRGIKPAAIIGHSVGEVAAAHVSGILSLSDAVKVIYHRSRLMQRATGFGKMASVELPLDKALAAIKGYEDKLGVGAHNSPTNTVLSGEPDALQEVVEKLEADGVFVRMLRVNYAFHSPHMEPYKQELIESLEGITLNKPTTPVYSTVTGQLSAGDDYGPVYWSNNIRERVRFADAVENAVKDGYTIFLELAPHPVLSASLSQCLREQKVEGTITASLRRKEDEARQMLIALATLYSKGLKVNWSSLLPTEARYIPLPTMVWNKDRYWFELKGNDPMNAPLYGRKGYTEDEGHPLLGTRKDSPLHPGKNFWETRIDLYELEYLKDHRIQESVVLPATAYLEMAFSAAKEAFGKAPACLEDVSFFKAMFLNDGKETTSQLILSPYTNGHATYQIFSPPEEKGQGTAPAWNFHSMGMIRNQHSDNGKVPEEFNIEELKSRLNNNMDVHDFFDQLHKRGLQYGPYFQGVKELFTGSQEALARVELAEKLQEQKKDYHIHPALLDACLQVLSAALPEEEMEDIQDTFMPVAIKKIHLYEETDSKVWSYARIREFDLDANDYITGDIIVLNEEGKPVLEIVELKLQRLGQKKETDLSDWFYRIDWQETESQPVPEEIPEEERGSWLIFADKQGLGQSLAEKLSALQEKVLFVQTGESFEEDDKDRFSINPTDASHYAKLVERAVAEDQPPFKGIVHLWALDAANSDQPDLDQIVAAQDITTLSALYTTQALVNAALRKNPALFLVTSGAVSVSEDDGAVQLAQSAMWGLGRVISVENPDILCRKIDLTQNAQIDELMAEIFTGDREEQIAWRKGQRLAARLIRTREDYQDSESTETADEQLLEVPDGPFRMQSTNPGVLGSLRYHPIQRIAPEKGQVEIEVYATGLNFRDVLMALGLYPGGPIPFGSECSGVVIRVGEGVDHLKEGDEVIGMAPHTFGKYVTTLADLIVKKPDTVNFDQGATIPITYLTAYYAMHYLGRLQKGERILIHAGAGGVGQAAIRIAQMIGAEVYTTAGSEEKHAFLREMGVTHIYNSRSLDFADQIMEDTRGEGVDMVLNSLAGEFIPRSLALLRPYGRFLEIGKTDIYQNSQIDMYPFRNNLAYFAIDLDMVSRDRPQLIRSLFLELIDHFNAGKLTPLPLTRFSAPEAVKAFRYMAQRKNIGKIVVSMKDTSVDQQKIPGDSGLVKADATYLITGGLGSLGLALAEWMANQGAKHLVLLGRSAPSEDAQKIIANLQGQGVETVIARGDVAEIDQMRDIFDDIARRMPPLKGIIHAAGLLDDQAILKLDAESLKKVMRPKVQGGWILHELTENMDIDFFVLFSSIAAIVGNPGQANYAAANMFMDMLAHYRKKRGLPAISINWGFWDQTGMANREGLESDKLLLKGSGKIKLEQGLKALSRLLKKDIAQSIVTPVTWSELLDPYPMDGIPPLYLLFKDEKVERADKGAVGGKKSITKEQLAGLNAEERVMLVAEFLQNQIAKVVGTSPAKLELDRPLNTLGLDSLMAIELKNSVEASVDATLPIATLLKGPAIRELAADIVEQMAGDMGEQEVDESIPVDTSENPLSYGQKAMWFQHLMAPTSIYNQVYAVRIPSKLDIDILRKSIDSLSRRHEALRTNFTSVNGQPVQIIHEEPQQILQELDVADLSETEIRKKMREFIDRPFDLENEPLTRIVMFKKAEDDYIFLYVGHHIVSDMWSLALFMYELDKLYTAGGYTELPEIGYTYVEFARWQNQMLRSVIGKRHLDYWKNELKGELPILNLPTDRPRPAIQTFNGETETAKLDHELTVRLKEISEKYGVTLYTFLLAGFKALLNRYTRQTDIIIGTPTYGRTSPEVMNVLGYFVNPIAIRTHVDGNDRFSDYLQQVNQKVVDGLDHQDYPFNLVVEKLQPRRDPSRTPIFQMMFVYQKAYLLHESGMSGLAVAEEGGTMKLGGVTLESMAIENRTLPFDMTMLMAELEDGLGISLQYNTDLFERETALRMIGHFKKFIEEVAKDPERPIAAYQFLSGEELGNML